MEDALREMWYTPLLYGCRILLKLMQQIFTVALPFLAAVTTSTTTLPFVNYQMDGPPPKVVEETAILEVAPVKPKEKMLICKGCSEHETIALNYFQSQGIKDKNALATILGNIKQESMFVPNICEGGGRTSYYNCYGGYGLIQWTSSDRYHGLGNFARRIGDSPSSVQTQLRYLTTETQWKQIESRLKKSGKSIDSYMNDTYSWIGWGIHGARTHYAYQYANKLVSVEV